LLRIVHDQHKLRVVRGWNLDHYRLKPGGQIEVEVLPESWESSKIRKQQWKGEEERLCGKTLSKIAETEAEDEA
jgi:hypothetical protein